MVKLTFSLEIPITEWMTHITKISLILLLEKKEIWIHDREKIRVRRWAAHKAFQHTKKGLGSPIDLVKRWWWWWRPGKAWICCSLSRMKRVQFYCWDFVLKHILTMVENGSTRFLTRFVSDKESCVNRFHTGWASETPHQPVINALSVISMHTGQIANSIPNDEFNHANNTSVWKR